MNVREAVLADLRSTKGVVTAELMDDDISCEIGYSERSIRTQGGLEFRNDGYTEAMQRHVRICVFCTEDFEFPDDRTIFLMTEDGTVMGHNVTEQELESFRARDDIIWVSDDFIMYTDRKGCGEEMFVCKGRKYPAIETYPGCNNGLIVVPAGPSDMILKSRYGVPNRREIASAVMAFDIT